MVDESQPLLEITHVYDFLYTRILRKLNGTLADIYHPKTHDFPPKGCEVVN
jgi:hypothetical protein